MDEPAARIGPVPHRLTTVAAVTPFGDLGYRWVCSCGQASERMWKLQRQAIIAGNRHAIREYYDTKDTRHG